MTSNLITHIRHVDIAVPDYDAQVEFYGTLWGLTEVGGETGLRYFAAEGSPEQYIVRVRRAGEKRLDLVSYGAADRASVDELAARLGTAGVQLVSEPDVLQTPGGGYGFRFSTSRAGPSRSPPTSRTGSTARSRSASPSPSGCPISS